jgi:hypothetical protein
MFDDNLVVDLCRKLLTETDPGRLDDLAKCLRTAVDSSIDQARLKLEFVAKHYPELCLPIDPDRDPFDKKRNRAA